MRINHPNRCEQFTGVFQIEARGGCQRTSSLHSDVGRTVPSSSFLDSDRTPHAIGFVGCGYAGHFEYRFRPHLPQRLLGLKKTGTPYYSTPAGRNSVRGNSRHARPRKRVSHLGTRTRSKVFDFFDDRFVEIIVLSQAPTRSHGNMPVHAWPDIRTHWSALVPCSVSIPHSKSLPLVTSASYATAHESAFRWSKCRAGQSLGKPLH